MSDMTEIQKKQIDKLIERIPYDEEIFGNSTNYKLVISDLIENSKYIALATLYPYEDYSEMELPNKYLNWQIRASIELYNLADKSALINYSENNLTWSRLTDGLSRSLMVELVPTVGIPKKKEVAS